MIEQFVAEDLQFDEVQSEMFNRISSATVRTTDGFKQEIIKGGGYNIPTLSEIDSNKDLRVFALSDYIKARDKSDGLKDKPSAYKTLNDMTLPGKSQLFEIDKDKLEEAKFVSDQYDTKLKVMSLQKKLGVTEDGILGNQSYTALSNFKTIYGEYPKAKENALQVTLDEFDLETIKQEGGKPSANGRYKQYSSLEGGTDTIGHGHKLKDNEIKSGKIHGIDYKNGLSKEEADYIYVKDKEQAMSKLGLDKASPNIQFLAADVAHRAGDISNWTFLKNLKDNELEKAYVNTADMYWVDKKGNIQFYNNRNKSIFKKAGVKISKQTQKDYDLKQQMAIAKFNKRKNKN